MLCVTLDTNVIISALNFSGNPARILELAEEGLIRLSVSDEILKEVERVLRRPKFGWPQEQINNAINGIRGFAEQVDPQRRLDIIEEDPTDNRILECAMASGADYLVSGDKHILKVRQFAGTKMVNPSEFLSLIGAQG